MKRTALLLIAIFQFSTISSGQDIHLDVEGNVKIVGRVDLVVDEMDTTSLVIGRGAGDSLISVLSSNNTFVGVWAGQSTISHNSCFGCVAALDNSFFGYSSGSSNRFGRANSFFGSRAGELQIDGSQNSFFGSGAGRKINSGIGNSFFGYDTGRNNITGSANTFVGNSSGTEQKGNDNTFVGSLSDGALNADSLQYAIAIGSRSKVACSHCAVIGGTNDNAVKVGIGLTGPRQNLHIHEDAPNEGSYLQVTNVETGNDTHEGLILGVDDEGYSTLMSRESEWMTLGVGGNEILTLNSNKLGIGTNNPNAQVHSHMDAATDNFVKTTNDLTGRNSSDGLNIGIQGQSGIINLLEDDDLTISTSNIARMTIKNDGRVGIGTTTPMAELDVEGNIRSSGNQIFIRDGNQVISLNTHPDSGYARLDVGGTGHFSDDIIIGDPNAALNKVGIGTSNPTEMLDVNGNLRIRNDVIVNQLLGIGTSAPTNELEVVGSASNGVAGFTRSDIAQSAKSHILHGTNGDWYIRPAVSTGKIVIADDGGNVGMGTDIPTHPLHMGSDAHCTAAGVWTDASDISKKYEIKPLQYGLTDILSLSPKSYKYKIDDSESIGFIAQEMEKVIQEVVSGVEGKKGIAYGQLTAVLVNAVKEQQRQIELLQQEVSYLSRKIADTSN